jgi:hypothetical protein
LFAVAGANYGPWIGNPKVPSEDRRRQGVYTQHIRRCGADDRYCRQCICARVLAFTSSATGAVAVFRDAGAETSKFDKHTIDCLVLSYATSLVQVIRALLTLTNALSVLTLPFALTTPHQAAKLGGGSSQYSMSWTDRGLLIHIKLEALIVTLVLEDDANLGLIDDHIVILKKILGPFSNSNFISVTL